MSGNRGNSKQKPRQIPMMLPNPNKLPPPAPPNRTVYSSFFSLKGISYGLLWASAMLLSFSFGRMSVAKEAREAIAETSVTLSECSSLMREGTIVLDRVTETLEER